MPSLREGPPYLKNSNGDSPAFRIFTPLQIDSGAQLTFAYKVIIYSDDISVQPSIYNIIALCLCVFHLPIIDRYNVRYI